jgi:hypothetical protein
MFVCSLLEPPSPALHMVMLDERIFVMYGFSCY